MPKLDPDHFPAEIKKKQQRAKSLVPFIIAPLRLRNTPTPTPTHRHRPQRQTRLQPLQALPLPRLVRRRIPHHLSPPRQPPEPGLRPIAHDVRQHARQQTRQLRRVVRHARVERDGLFGPRGQEVDEGGVDGAVETVVGYYGGEEGGGCEAGGAGGGEGEGEGGDGGLGVEGVEGGLPGAEEGVYCWGFGLVSVWGFPSFSSLLFLIVFLGVVFAYRIC